MIALYIILAILVVFLIVVLARTAAFRPTADPEESFEDVDFGRDAAVEALGKLVQCRTVSSSDPAKEDNAEFDRLTGMLPDCTPM